MSHLLNALDQKAIKASKRMVEWEWPKFVIFHPARKHDNSIEMSSVCIAYQYSKKRQEVMKRTVMLTKDGIRHMYTEWVSVISSFREVFLYESQGTRVRRKHDVTDQLANLFNTQEGDGFWFDDAPTKKEGDSFWADTPSKND